MSNSKKWVTAAACMLVVVSAAVTALGASAATGGRAGAHPPVCKAGKKTTLKKPCAYRWASGDCAKFTKMIKTTTGLTVTATPKKDSPIYLWCEYTVAGKPRALTLMLYPGATKSGEISVFNQYKNTYGMTCTDGSTPALPKSISRLGSLAFGFDPCPNGEWDDTSDHYSNMTVVRALHVTNNYTAITGWGLYLPAAKLVPLVRAMIAKYP